MCEPKVRVQSAKFVESHQGNINKLSIFGQDSNPTTWKLCQMNANGKFKAEKRFSAVVKTADIAKQDYILTPSRYVGLADQADDGEPFDEKMVRLTSELAGYFDESHKLEKEIKKRLGAIGFEV
jgi:type I restriction-modification system DNA methylase subunit